MEKKQTPPKRITVTDATIIFADGMSFHASRKLLKELSERASKEQMLTIPKENPENCDYSLQWIED